MSRDDIPLIGRAPGHRHLWLATGHGMMGVGMSAGTGQMLADLVAGRAPAVDPAAFDPARFARVHRSYIVNLDCVGEIEPLDTGDARIAMRDGAVIPCSRTYRDALRPERRAA